MDGSALLGFWHLHVAFFASASPATAERAATPDSFVTPQSRSPHTVKCATTRFFYLTSSPFKRVESGTETTPAVVTGRPAPCLTSEIYPGVLARADRFFRYGNITITGLDFAPA